MSTKRARVEDIPCAPVLRLQWHRRTPRLRYFDSKRLAPVSCGRPWAVELGATLPKVGPRARSCVDLSTLAVHHRRKLLYILYLSAMCLCTTKSPRSHVPSPRILRYHRHVRSSVQRSTWGCEGSNLALSPSERRRRSRACLGPSSSAQFLADGRR